MTPLRHKMTDDLRLRNLSEGTREAYLRCVARFAAYYRLSPDKLGAQDVREFLLGLDLAGRAPATRAVYHAALKFLYVHTLGRPEVMATVPRPRVPSGGPPMPLTRPEVRALLDVCASSPFDYTFFATMLATGARISECCALSVHDIDRRARLVHIRHGKGDKARSVMLSAKHLRLLERYWKVEELQGECLFPAQRMTKPGVIDPRRRWAAHPVSKSTMGARMAAAVKRAGLKRPVTSHDLRRTFATWLLEEKGDLRLVQVLLGHASPATTARYTLVHANTIANTVSPYDLL